MASTDQVDLPGIASLLLGKPEGFFDWRHPVLPSLALGWSFSEAMLRLTRSSMLEVHGLMSRHGSKNRVDEVLELVGLPADTAHLLPREFSEGQRQRIAIARALGINAELIVLDEPVSALDVFIRAHILTPLEELQRELGMSYVFIGHDLAAVAHISDWIAVMYLGKIVETAESLELSNNSFTLVPSRNTCANNSLTLLYRQSACSVISPGPALPEPGNILVS